MEVLLSLYIHTGSRDIKLHGTKWAVFCRMSIVMTIIIINNNNYHL